MSASSSSTWVNLNLDAKHSLTLCKDSNNHYLFGPGLTQRVIDFSLKHANGIMHPFALGVDGKRVSYIEFKDQTSIARILTHLGSKRYRRAPKSWNDEIILSQDLNQIHW